MQLRRGLDILEEFVDGWQLPEAPSERSLREIAALAGLPFEMVLAISKKTLCRPGAHDRDADSEFIRAVRDAMEEHHTAESKLHQSHQVISEEAE